MRNYLVNIKSNFDGRQEDVDYYCAGIDLSKIGDAEHFMMYDAIRPSDESHCPRIGLVCKISDPDVSTSEENEAELKDGFAVITVSVNNDAAPIKVFSMYVDHYTGKKLASVYKENLADPKKVMEDLQHRAAAVRETGHDEEEHRPG